MVNIEMKGVTDGVHSYMKACADRIPKAVQNGVYKESYRTAKEAKAGLKAGAPGSKPLAPHAPFTKLKVRKFKTSGNRSPLSRLGPAIRYKVRKAGDKTSSTIGFIAGSGLDRLAAEHAKGYSIPMTEGRARGIAKILRKAGIPKGPGRGRDMKVPAREIIGPVYEAEKDNIYNNIRQRVINAAKVGGRY